MFFIRIVTYTRGGGGLLNRSERKFGFFAVAVAGESGDQVAFFVGDAYLAMR